MEAVGLVAIPLALLLLPTHWDVQASALTVRVGRLVQRVHGTQQRATAGVDEIDA